MNGQEWALGQWGRPRPCGLQLRAVRCAELVRWPTTPRTPVLQVQPCRVCRVPCAWLTKHLKSEY